MRSSNPVLTRDVKQYGFSGGTRPFTNEGLSVSLDSVIVRSATLLGLVIVSGAAAWLLEVPMIFALVSSLVAFAIGMVAAIMRKTVPVLYITYAVLEGVAVGVVSRLYEGQYRGIVLQALIGVLAVFATMLTLYRVRVIRATGRFAKFLIIAAGAYIALMLVNLIVGIFVPGGFGLTSGGPLAIVASVAGVTIGALFYILDFDEVERLIAARAPETESWRAAFGLTLTTVWVYLEILRLLGYLRR